jgi:hypothetical protein
MMKNLLDVAETAEAELLREGQAIAPPDVADELKLPAGAQHKRDIIAAALDLEVGDPVLKVARVFRMAALRPVQHITMFLRPDRYEYTLILPAADAIY